jgi:hypothetical protein
MMIIIQWLINHIGFASWNPLKKVPAIAETAAKDETTWTTWDWLKVIIAIVAPLGIVWYVLNRFGILRKIKGYVFGVKRRRRRSSIVARAKSVVRRRTSGTARQKQLAALARGRATRKRNARAKRKK